MKKIRIYQPVTLEVGISTTLDKPSGKHLIKVLRLKNNDTFTLFNGDGNEYQAQLEISGKSVCAHIVSCCQPGTESNLNIHLLQGISKGERMDFAIQKAVELGVTSITPVITERTVVNLKHERREKKQQHWQAIAVSACEQSGRNVIPEINNICNLTQTLTSKIDGLKLLLDPLSKIPLAALSSCNSIQILIGPEGGFSATEIEQAKSEGFTGIKFGPRILRTETAALAAITSVQLLWGDLSR